VEAIAMTVADLTQQVQFIVDAEGNRTAAVLEIAVWEQILTILKNIEDTEAMRRSAPDDEVTAGEPAKVEPRPAGLAV
jgi:hypothetical protein